MSERTTVRLPPALLDRAKRKARAEHRTLTSLIEEGLTLVLSARRPPTSAKLNNPPVSTAGGGPTPGLDREDRSSSVQELEDLEYVERMKRFE